MPTFDGSCGTIHYEQWLPHGEPTGIVVLVHGYAEYGARYAHVAERLTSLGVAVYAEDHMGHGHSDGERALITDFGDVVADLETLVRIATDAHPEVPLLMIGHSMGGLLTARFAQANPDAVAGIGFLGAVIGDWNWARDALAAPELPEAATDFSGMSRDEATVVTYSTDALIYRGRYKRPLLEAEMRALDGFQADIDRLTMKVKMADVRAYADGNLSEEDLIKKIQVEET